MRTNKKSLFVEDVGDPDVLVGLEPLPRDEAHAFGCFDNAFLFLERYGNWEQLRFWATAACSS
jgi:hypothetical protein